MLASPSPSAAAETAAQQGGTAELLSGVVLAAHPAGSAAAEPGDQRYSDASEHIDATVSLACLAQLQGRRQSSAPTEEQAQQQEQAHSPALQQRLLELSSSLHALEATSDQVASCVKAASCDDAKAGATDRQQQAAQPSTSSTPQPGADAEQLQQQLAALAAEKERVEADRQELAGQQGAYKGTIARLEGALAFSERKVKDQLAALETLQAQVATLTAELQAARGAAAITPDRCRTAAQALQAEADRAARRACTNEAQVKKLKHIVQLEARELAELLDFAEQERLTLLDKEAVLQQELEQLRGRAVAAEKGASDVHVEKEAVEGQLAAVREELAASQARLTQLEEALAEAQAALLAEQGQAATLAAERDAAARNLLRAEAELNDVSEYSTKMFRQVRFISHVLDKNGALLGKLPEFANLSRDLRAFVAANTRTWEPRDERTSSAATGGGAATSAAAPCGGGSRGMAGTAAAAQQQQQVVLAAADTTASGMRDK